MMASQQMAKFRRSRQGPEEKRAPATEIAWKLNSNLGRWIVADI
jgi:hypothetical protein